MTTYKLTTTPKNGVQTVKTGLTREQAMYALTDLMYGGWDDEPALAEHEQRTERLDTLAAAA